MTSAGKNWSRCWGTKRALVNNQVTGVRGMTGDCDCDDTPPTIEDFKAEFPTNYGRVTLRSRLAIGSQLNSNNKQQSLPSVNKMYLLTILLLVTWRQV